jgi:hypothetical protein
MARVAFDWCAHWQDTAGSSILVDMTRFVGIRVTEEEHRRIREAAALREISVNEFVHKAVIGSVQHVESRLARKANKIEVLLIGARHGPPGYRECGRKFAEWLNKSNPRELRELQRSLAVVDAEMLRREKFKTLFSWCDKHFAFVTKYVPTRRRKPFAEGLMSEIDLSQNRPH